MENQKSATYVVVFVDAWSETKKRMRARLDQLLLNERVIKTGNFRNIKKAVIIG